VARDSNARINISLNVVNLGSEFEPYLSVLVRRKKDSNAVLHAKVEKKNGGKYIIDAMVDGEERCELEDLAQAAFDLGRRFEMKYGTPGKRVPQAV